MTADVAIISWLGNSHRKRRLDMHLRQRFILDEQFPDLRIVSYCSEYPKWARNAMEGQGYETVHKKERHRKWEWYNVLLTALYRSSTLKSVLFLDQDIVPRPLRPGDAEDGLVDVPALIRHYLKHPDQMAGQCTFFSAAGLLFDAYWKAKKAVVEPAPHKVVGWAVMVRSDLNVLYTPEVVKTMEEGGSIMDDCFFRAECVHRGRTVLKHNRAFFKTFQSKTADGASTYVETEAERKKLYLKSERLIREAYPDQQFPNRRR